MHADSARHGGIAMVGPVSVVTSGSTRRVTVDAHGTPLWFESADLPLSAAPEAYGSALLIPALHHRLRLRLADPVDSLWFENIGQMIPVLRKWWRYPAWLPEVSVAEASPGASVAVAARDQGPSALFFSGGVDSFHRLLRGVPRPDWLVTLWGFDFPLDDTKRGAAVEDSLRRIAAATGTRAAVVRTNARQHPLISATPWERGHGGVLAGVGHLLAPTATRAMISDSKPGDLEIPYGSHWSIDPLWSSSRTAILHGGRGGQRVDKLREIASHPLVREHLRVCWRNLAPTGNCSRCVKCLLAMVILESCGELEHSRVFEGRAELPDRIAALRRTSDRTRTFAELALTPNLDPRLAASVQALVQRSHHASRLDVRLRRAAASWLLARLGTFRRRESAP